VSRPPRLRTILVAVGAFVLADVAVAVIALGAHPSRAPAVARPAPDLPVGTALDKPVGRKPLIDEHGRPTSLAAFRGRWLVLAPSLTLCHEVCPLTTGALDDLRRRLAADGLGSRVVVAEATVDPWRDTPARVRAFKRLTGTRVRFLTGTRAEVRSLWRTFGVFYRRVAQGHPPDVDWWTHRPETFDVQHTDGVFLVDPRGRLRVAVPGMPDVAGLPKRLAALLDDEGRANERAPDSPWTAAQIAADLERLTGTRRRGRPHAGAGRPGAAAAGRPRRPAEPDVLRPDAARALPARLRGLRGRPVVVAEWASWCPPCHAEARWLGRVAARHAGRVAFVGLDVNDDAAAARRFLARTPLGFPSYSDADGRAAARLGDFRGLPTTVFIRPSGQVAFVHAGRYTGAAGLEQDLARHLTRRRP
jgi:protein SCO1/2